MISPKCCVFSKKAEDLKRLEVARVAYRINECQFSKTLPELIKVDDEYFCILHTPYEYKQKNNLMLKAREAFEIHVKDHEFTNFDYIQVEGVEYNSVIVSKILRFVGAFIVGIKISLINNMKMDLIFNYSTISCVSIINCKLRYISIFGACISDYFLVSNTTTENIIISETKIKGREKFFREDSEPWTFKFENCKNTKMLEISKNICPISFIFENSEFNKLVFSRNLMSIAPVFDSRTLVEEIYLPKKRDYNLKFLKKNVRDLSMPGAAGEELFWEKQYRRFREIYLITKQRDLYSDQDEYYSLMQDCYRSIPSTLQFTKLFNFLNQLISNYGQFIGRPILLMLMCYLIMTISCFFCLPMQKELAPIIAIQQIIRPASILFDSDQKEKFYDSLRFKPTGNYKKSFEIKKQKNQIRYNLVIFSFISLLMTILFFIFFWCLLKSINHNNRRE